MPLGVAFSLAYLDQLPGLDTEGRDRLADGGRACETDPPARLALRKGSHPLNPPSLPEQIPIRVLS
jgi:hypothetical protein